MYETQQGRVEAKSFASFEEYLARAVSLQQSTSSAERDFVHVVGELGEPFCIRGAGQKSYPLDFSFVGIVHLRSSHLSEVSYRHHVSLDAERDFDVSLQSDSFFDMLYRSFLQRYPDFRDNFTMLHECGSLDADFWLQNPCPSREYTV